MSPKVVSEAPKLSPRMPSAAGNLPADPLPANPGPRNGAGAAGALRVTVPRRPGSAVGSERNGSAGVVALTAAAVAGAPARGRPSIRRTSGSSVGSAPARAGAAPRQQTSARADSRSGVGRGDMKPPGMRTGSGGGRPRQGPCGEPGNLTQRRLAAQGALEAGPVQP